MAEYSRPAGWRFDWGGLNTKSAPDAVPPNKYPAAQNIRAVGDGQIQGRPGYVPTFTAAAGVTLTDLRAYATLGTDDAPRYLARDAANHVVLDTGATLATLAGTVGSGAMLLPFRPGASAQSWMYVASLGDYQKFSAPSAANAVSVAKVGIAEPQVQVEAAPQGPQFYEFTGAASAWTPGGTAGALVDQSLVGLVPGYDIATAIFQDPALSSRYTVQVSEPGYLPGMLLTFAKSGGGSFRVVVQEVLPAVFPSGPGSVVAIAYDSGTSGLCTIVPTQMALSSVEGVGPVSSIARGSLFRINQGANSEVVMVLGTVEGPQGQLAFRTSTVATYAAGASLYGLLGIVVDGIDATVVGQHITSSAVYFFASAKGAATISQSFAASPFAQALSGGAFPQNDDYLHFFLQIQVPSTLVQATLIFNVGTTVDYVTEIFQYVVTDQSLFQANPFNIVDFAVPLSALVSSGLDSLSTLTSCNGIQLNVATTGATGIVFGLLSVQGGGQPDVGADGTPYMYRIVPRASATGALGNPSPEMRYGVTPSRQNVSVLLPSVAAALPTADAQVDTWDVFRVGGQYTSYQYLGSGAPGTTFVDQYFQPNLAYPLATSNFEPWPSVAPPFSVTSDGGTTIAAIGDKLVVSGAGVAWPAEISRWLPGTLILLDGTTAFTLRARPTALSGTSYLFQTEENMSSLTPATMVVQEPDVARQPAPWMCGPNAAGDFFAWGDSLRPGVVYFSAHYAPDSAPDTNTLELTEPSAPLVAGVVMNGVTYVASTTRWWALYPAFESGATYNQVEQPVGRAPISPYGVCSDKTQAYFWARDGICATSGGPATDLTSADLYNLFPHEGVQGANVTRNGVTYYAPDYSRVATFRLAVSGGFLYADYQDSTGTPRTLVCDLKRGAWCADRYRDAIAGHYSVEQQEGSLTSAASLRPTLTLYGAGGNAWTQADRANDGGPGGAAIPAALATFEFDGGDLRAQPRWGDLYLDAITPAGLNAQPTSNGMALGPATAVPASASRQFTPVSVAGQVTTKFLGLTLTWSDNYATQSAPTVLEAWQPSLQPQPETTTDRFGAWSGSLGG